MPDTLGDEKGMGNQQGSDDTPIRRSIPISDFHTPAKPQPEQPEPSETPNDEPAETADENPVNDAEAPEETTLESDESEEDSDLVDQAEDKAVDDIQKADSEELLKSQDEMAQDAVVMKQSPWERFKNWNAAWWANPRKRYGTLGAFVMVLGVLLAVPFTRFNLIGLVLRSDVTVVALDNKSGKPVSGATVFIDGKKGQTDASGKVVMHIHAGSKNLRVSKNYYTSYSHGVLVGLSPKQNSFKAPVKALGRQVSVKVVNKITNGAVAGATVEAGGSTAKTDSKGLATIVVPASTDNMDAKVSQNGFNTAKVKLIPGGDLAKNTYVITPAGKLYFLSNLSGKLDVVKTDLDGANRETVLAGTGNEDRSQTSLLASRDWKYLALLSRRSGSNASIYLIDTTNKDKFSTIDEGNADFSLVGWSGHNFTYQVTRNSVNQWQSNRQALKSYNAETGQNLLLDQTQAAGSDQNNYLSQYIGSPYIINDQVVYSKNWQATFNNWSQLSSKSAELDSIGSNGSGHKTVKTFTLDGGPVNTGAVYINTQLYAPSELFINFTTDSKNSFYEYQDGKVSETTEVNADTFFSTPYATYLASPSGTSTFWAEQRDGKNTLFIGDKDAKNQKQVASLSQYNTYGWYSDDYLLVSKNSSELYIMSSKGGGTPLKITDYYKPAVNYNGYGGGYGGR
jgi:hypothetical protein